MYYFISELHLGHANILKYDSRPFVSIEEHDLALANNINATLRSGDTLFHLGDIAWSQKAYDIFLERVRGDIDLICVKGNHDVGRVEQAGWWPDVIYRNDLQRGSPPVFMSHYPHLSWPNSFHGSIHLYGHVHGNVKGVGRSMEVSANVISYTPISLDEVIAKLPFTKTHNV